MSSINKFAWSGAAVVLALIMSLGLMIQPASATDVTVTATSKTVSIATNAATGTGACTLLSSVVLASATATHPATAQTFILTLPAGWSWCGTAGTIAVAGTTAASPSTTPVTAAAVMTSATVVTGTVTVTPATNTVKFTWAGLGVRPDTAATSTGNVALTGTGATAEAAAIVLTAGGSMTAAYSLTALSLLAPGSTCDATGMANALSQPVSVPADGSAGWVICTLIKDDAGNPAGGAGVTFTVSLGIVSTGTGKTVMAISNATGYATTAYRGSGNVAATDTLIATYTLKNAVITQSATLAAGSGGTASKITVGAPNILAVASVVTAASPGYVSPTFGTRPFVRVLDASGVGVNGQVVLISIDRGSLVAGLDTACAGVTAKSITGTTAAAVVVPSGASEAGAIAFTMCTNQLDAPGKATITAQNISTTMANATLSVSNAGRPANITATAVNSAVTATIVDAGGNNVADGTVVRFTMSSQAGAVSSSCSSTTNGKATTVAALIAATGTVIVSTDWNESGSIVPGCAAVSAGAQNSQVTVTTGAQMLAVAVNLPTGTTTAGGTTPPVVTPPVVTPPVAAGSGTISSGTVPATGFGLIVFGGGTTAQLVTASKCAAATAAFFATTATGGFVVFVPGTTIAAVNADFLALYTAGNIPAGTALLGKCA